MAMVMLALPALAAPAQFSNFSVELPQGWTSNAGGDKAELKSADGKCVVYIAFVPAAGKGEKSFAQELAKQMNGTNVEQIEGADNYGFEVTVKGLDGYATTGVEKDMGFYFIETGAYDTWQSDIGNIWNSMKSTDPKVKVILNTLIPE